MTKRYTLPAVTVDGRDTSISIEVDNDAKLRKWLYNVRYRRDRDVPRFRFHWSRDPHATEFNLVGSLLVAHRRDEIYVKLQLCYEDYYRDGLYPLDEFCRMLHKGTRPSLGWRIIVTVQ